MEHGNPEPSDLDELDKYFMKIAIDASTRSNDEFKVGACIVNDEKKIVGIGYNAMPNYLDDKFPFEKNKHNKLDCKLTYVCHAELNAIVNKMCCSVKNCTIYVTRHPCNECAKLIVQSGINRVVYMPNPRPERDNKWDVQAAEKIFEKTGVTIRDMHHIQSCAPYFETIEKCGDKFRGNMILRYL